ncbi:MAG: lytic transglycosylase domain-containing protein [Thermodesulfobacteriota bacterium]
MLGRILPLVALVFALAVSNPVGAETVHHNSMSICALIISELTEGKIGVTRAREISLAIAEAANRHFGRVTCGEMWLYLAIVHVESRFRNNVVNHYNCRGMFQIHAPSWARKFGVSYSDLLDLETNADIGIQIWKYYLETYKHVTPALSAYNSDHPRAAAGYARAVLSLRMRIKKRYTQLYKAFRSAKMMAALTPDTTPSELQENPF